MHQQQQQNATGQHGDECTPRLCDCLSLMTAEMMVYVKGDMMSSAATGDSMVSLDHMVVDA
jgi:hypothetical protein